MPTMREFRRMLPVDPKKRAEPEREHAAVLGDEPIPVAVRRRGHADDRAVQPHPSRRTEERHAVGEDAAVATEQPVAVRRGVRGDVDDAAVERHIGCAECGCGAERLHVDTGTRARRRGRQCDQDTEQRQQRDEHGCRSLRESHPDILPSRRTPHAFSTRRPRFRTPASFRRFSSRACRAAPDRSSGRRGTAPGRDRDGRCRRQGLRRAGRRSPPAGTRRTLGPTAR